MTKSVYQKHILEGLKTGPATLRTIMQMRDVGPHKKPYMIAAVKVLLWEHKVECVSLLPDTTYWLDNMYALKQQ